MTNKHKDNFDGGALRDTLVRATDRATDGSTALWARILHSHTNKRRNLVRPLIAVGATALAAAALVIALPRWISGPDLIRPLASATIQPSADATATSTQTAAPAATVAGLGDSQLEERFSRAANGDASISQLYADVVAMVQSNDSRSATLVSRLMETLLARKADLSGRLYDMTVAENGSAAFSLLMKLEGKTNLGDASGLTKDQKALLDELFAAGYTVGFTDGSPYAAVRYGDFKRQFAAAMDDELTAYVHLSLVEAEGPYLAESLLSISMSELAARYLNAQSYLDAYDENAQNKPETHPQRTQDISYLTRGYLSALFTLNGSLFAGEERTVPQEYRNTYDTAIAENQSKYPVLAQLLSQYKTLLQAENWKLTDDVRNFLAEHGVPEYGPAQRLIWAELSIYGIRLDAEGEAAIAKLTSAIGSAPASDTTTDDAGGKTRTLTWSDGTIATLRNGKVYSLETTSAKVSLVRGLQIGDPTETLTAYLGQPLQKGEAWTWGVGSNNNVFAWITDNQLVRFKVSLTE